MLESTFTAIPPLSRSDADISVNFLASNVTYQEAVRDPWFEATVLEEGISTVPNGTEVPLNYYRPNRINNVVACAEQHQLRNPSNGNTSALGGLEVLTRRQARELGFNDHQLQTFDRSFMLGGYSVLGYLVPALGGSQLLTAANRSWSSSTSMPDNQWQYEFEHYFGVGLVALQIWSEQYVNGPIQPSAYKYVVPGSDDFSKAMCTSQIVRRNDYRSFSVLGMSIIFVIGLLFTLANLIVPSIVKKAQQHSWKGRYHNEEWQANEVLQLQRMAYQHADMGTWTGHHDMVPRTGPGEVFALPETARRSKSGIRRNNGTDTIKSVRYRLSGTSQSSGNASVAGEKLDVMLAQESKGFYVTERSI